MSYRAESMRQLIRFSTSRRYSHGLTLDTAIKAVCTSRWFEPSSGSQEKRPFSNGLFSIQSEGLACNLTAGEHVIAEGVWHHASACILLRIDYIHHSVMIPYKALPWFHTADKLRISSTPIGVILRVAFLYYEHKQKRVTIWLLAFVFFLVRLKPIIFCLTVVPIPIAR